MNDKRIAIFIPDLKGGGAESTMLVLAKGLQARGYMVDLLLKKRIGSLIASLPDSINIIEFDVPIMRYTFGRLIAYFQKVKPDAIISALELPNIISILARMAVKKKPRVIISIHGLTSKQKPIYQKQLDRLLFGGLYLFADAIVCVSNVCAEDAIKYLHLPKIKVKVIYNPVIDDELYRKVSEPVLFDWFNNSKRKTILTIGRLEMVKDHMTLLKAFQRVKDTYDSQLIIIGEGSLHQELRQQIVEMGLENDVIMTGFITRPYNIIAKSDIFVLSSLHESFSNVVIEALGCRCPIVSTRCGGPEEILGFGKYGHLVPIGDVQAMANAILQVLGGDKRPAPSEWLDQFHVDHSVNQYVRLIEAQT